MTASLTGQRITAGPAYREGPDQFRPLVLRMPNTARYQPREEFAASMLGSQIKPEPTGPRGIPDRAGKFAPEPKKSEKAREVKRASAQARKGPEPALRVPRSKTYPVTPRTTPAQGRPTNPDSLTQRIVSALRTATVRLTAAQVGALIGCDSREIGASLAYWAKRGEVTVGRGPDGKQDYAMTARLAAGLVADRMPEFRDPERLQRSCTANILAALQAGDWMDRRAILAGMPNPAYTLDAISNRMGRLFKSGAVVSRKTPDPHVRGGVRTEYRLTWANTGSSE